MYSLVLLAHAVLNKVVVDKLHYKLFVTSKILLEKDNYIEKQEAKMKPILMQIVLDLLVITNMDVKFRAMANCGCVIMSVWFKVSF